MVYSNTQLEAILGDLESDLYERKEAWKGKVPDAGRAAVCAFANDLPDHQKPGILFVGVDDNGTPTGLEITDQLLQTLADIKTDGQILPQPSLIIEKRKLKDIEVAVISVQPATSPPVRYKGRIYIRTGPRKGIASAQDEAVLNEKRRFKDIPFDIQPFASATLEDIDRRSFEEEYLPQATEIRSFNLPSKQQQFCVLFGGVHDRSSFNLF